MADSGSIRPVLVGVADPDTVQQLVRTAGDLAAVGDGALRLVTVVVKARDSPFGVFDDETIVREFGGESQALLAAASKPEGVTIDRQVYVARSVAAGLLAAIEDSDPVSLVVGWQAHTSRSDALFGTNIDTLIARAPCDLYVERIGHEAGTVESVLLPVAGGPHVPTAARAATAIASRNDAQVFVLSIKTPERTTEAAESSVAAGRDAIAQTRAPEIPVQGAVQEAPTATDGIVAVASDHDVIVLGASRQGELRRRLAGSVPRRIVNRTDRTVIVARAGSVATGLLGRIGGLLRQ